MNSISTEHRSDTHARPHDRSPELELPAPEDHLELSTFLALQDKVPFLRKLTLERLIELWPYAQKRGYSAGEIIRDEGEGIDFVAIILEGRLSIEKTGGCKKTRYLLAELDAGSWELSMLGSTESGIIATAMKPTEILIIGREALDEILEAHPELGVLLLREMTRVLGIRLRKSSERLLDVL